MQSIDSCSSHTKAEVLDPGAGYTRLILPLMPRATGAAQARPGWFELHPQADMDRMQCSQSIAAARIRRREVLVPGAAIHA